MHSKIFQMSATPIDKDGLLRPADLDDNSSDFADYIGDELHGEERTEQIEWLTESMQGVLSYIGDGKLRYNGLGTFLEDWAAEVKWQAREINGGNILMDLRRYSMSTLMDKTHRDMDCRFYTENWSGCAEPLGDFIAYLSTLKEGTTLYVGSVIDFHF